MSTVCGHVAVFLVRVLVCYVGTLLTTSYIGVQVFVVSMLDVQGTYKCSFWCYTYTSGDILLLKIVVSQYGVELKKKDSSINEQYRLLGCVISVQISQRSALDNKLSRTELVGISTAVLVSGDIQGCPANHGMSSENRS